MVVQNQYELDKVVYKEFGDRLVRAVTTASSLEAEQDNDNTLQRDEDRLKLEELVALCTNLQNRVLDLEKTKTTQHNEIAILKRRVKKLEKRNKSRTHKLKRLYKVGLTARVESSGDEESLGEDASKQGRRNDAVDVDKDITLVSVHDDVDNKMFDVDALDAKRADEKRNKPPTQAQQRKIMYTYLKNIEVYKLKDLKLTEFDRIQEIFDKAFKKRCKFSESYHESFGRFQTGFGLILSLPKSAAYFCNVLKHVKVSILQILPFEEGNMPVKYLGVPFLWSHGNLHKGHAKVAWDVICLLKTEGGLGIRSPLSNMISNRDIYKEGFNHRMKLDDMISNGVFLWPNEWYVKYPLVNTLAPPAIVLDRCDKLEWFDDDGTVQSFSVHTVWNSIRSRSAKLKLKSCRWKKSKDALDVAKLWNLGSEIRVACHSVS
uniref:RNA-directed DNA polymerase, eukaryota, reverse transcriptase zinc-binding domain protein n=1 Tax=Tanacetum cinerariifolium TaxID=118510 RepID=A0A6L2JPV2_TANCI|nr:hypothetical protein [Tanacetum cinerariifolium]